MEDKDISVKDEFCSPVRFSIYLNLLPSKDIKMLLSDFNAKIGKEVIHCGTAGGHSLHDKVNENGNWFIGIGRAIQLLSSRQDLQENMDVTRLNDFEPDHLHPQ